MTVIMGKADGPARAGEALIARHAELLAVLDHWAGVLSAAAGSRGPVRPVRNLLRAVLTDEVLPLTRAEERTLCRRARRDPDTALLIEALISEHRDLAARTARLGEPAPSADTAAQAAEISVLFASHVAAEDGLLLPALERSGADLAALVAHDPRLAGIQCAA